MTPAVEVDGVTRRFGAMAAVDDVSLQVLPGEFVSLLGPSGCGKTTLLRLIGGFELPDQGAIRLDGRDVTREPPERRRTNLVFQSLALFPHMSVAENVAFGLQMGRVREPELGRRVAAALELVRLDGFGARRVGELSGGQRQRVAIARAVVNRPAVLLLDEPLGALDLRLRQELQDELRRLQRALGSPVIFVTHDQTEAMAMSDRVAVMNRGRIEQAAPPRALYDHPASLFVARFVGSSNLIEGVVVRQDGTAIEARWPGGLVLCAKAGAGAGAGTAGERVVLCLRHEALTLAPPDANLLPARVTDRVFLGPAVRYTVQPEAGPPLVAETPIGRGEPVRNVGEAVGLAWSDDAIQAFRGETNDG